MYEIYADDELIYSDVTPLETVKVVNPKLTLADSAAGQLDMSLPPINKGYSSIERMTTNIHVYCDSEWIWSGRVLQDAYDFWNNRKMVCEGELAFLNDSIQPPAKYDVSNSHTTVRTFLEALITIHNSQVSADRRFVVGDVSVNDSGDQSDNENENEIYRFTNYESTLECINEKLVSRLGGHLIIRHQDGSRILDYVGDDYLPTNSQVVRFGVNLLDFSKNIDMSQLATAICPRGARLDDDSAVEVEGLEPYLTVKQCDATAWHDANSIFVKDQTAVDNFGWVCSVVDWDKVTVKENLYNKAVKYLQDEQYEKMILEIKALDLKYLMQGDQPIKFMSKLRCISEPHDMDHTFLVSKMEIDLTNPSNNYYTLGTDVTLSLTSATSKANSSFGELINSMPSKSEILKAAERNAYQMITGVGGNSYVHLIPGRDANGKNNGINRIEVTDGPTYDPKKDSTLDPQATGDPFPDSLSRWIFSEGGIGHIGRQNYQTAWSSVAAMNVAMTKNGAINATMITTGDLNCDRLNGGTINGQTIVGGSLKSSDSNDSSYVYIQGGRLQLKTGDQSHYMSIYTGDYHCDFGGTRWGCYANHYGSPGWLWFDPSTLFILIDKIGDQPNTLKNICDYWNQHGGW